MTIDAPHHAIGRRGFFRVLALDFDGTLTHTGRLDDGVISSILGARGAGIRIVLATGRILDELLAVEPVIPRLVDAIVAENGCVLVHGGTRRLARPVDPRLDRLLADRGVTFRRGQVLVACAGSDDRGAFDAVRELGEAYQLVRNRSELMIVPEGVTKGSGVQAALSELGLSPHNAIGVGDAENDQSLFDVCELGVAVANAVEQLRDQADLILPQPDGAGIEALLEGPVVRGRAARPPSRWTLDLGADAEGRPVRLPASQLNVLLAGGTGSGKSHAAGLMAEQLIRHGYSVLVIDPEGDHRGLADLPHVVVVGDGDLPLSPAVVLQMMGHPGSSVVVDLSGMPARRQNEYLDALPTQIEAHRALAGLPHWVISDEAHRTLGPGQPGAGGFDTFAKGHILATWRARELRPDVLASMDVGLAFGDADDAAEVVAAIGAVPPTVVAAALSQRPHAAVMTRREHPGQVVSVDLRPRATPHLRHEHKYERMGVSGLSRFFFWDPPGTRRTATASNLGELGRELADCPASAVRHHAGRGDFSRWIDEVLRDDRLAASIASVEGRLGLDPSPEAVEQVRLALIRLLEGRHT